MSVLDEFRGDDRERRPTRRGDGVLPTSPAAAWSAEPSGSGPLGRRHRVAALVAMLLLPVLAVVHPAVGEAMVAQGWIFAALGGLMRWPTPWAGPLLLVVATTVLVVASVATHAFRSVPPRWRRVLLGVEIAVAVALAPAVLAVALDLLVVVLVIGALVAAVALVVSS